MEKSYVMNQLEKNEISHEKLNEKIEGLKTTIHNNHVELLNAIHSNKVETEKVKVRYGLMGLGVSALTLIGDYVIRKI